MRYNHLFSNISLELTVVMSYLSLFHVNLNSNKILYMRY